jgi:hypothetical protein
MAPARGKSGQSRPENDPRGCKKGLGYSAGLLSLKLVPISNMSMSSSWKLQIQFPTCCDEVTSEANLAFYMMVSQKGSAMILAALRENQWKISEAAGGRKTPNKNQTPLPEVMKPCFYASCGAHAHACPFVIFCDKCQCVSSGLRVRS